MNDQAIATLLMTQSAEAAYPIPDGRHQVGARIVTPGVLAAHQETLAAPKSSEYTFILPAGVEEKMFHLNR
jgi:hypothetical protein